MTPTGFDATPFTIAHFVVMGVFALLALAGILWGIRLKRRRRQAEQDFDAHREAADMPPAVPVETDTPAAPPATTPPAGPPPPAAPPPVTLPPVAPPVSSDATAGDVTQLKGLGPKLAATLAGLGITRIEQIAAMTPDELDALDARLGAFRGRAARDRWADQARLLAAGDRAGYEAEFGKLGG